MEIPEKMLQNAADPNLEYVKIALTFVGALLGSMIGTPLIEWFKDQLGAKRQWKTQRNEIVATIRLISGILAAFDELRKEAYGPSASAIEYSKSGFERLCTFDFTLLDANLVKLSALHPEESGRSAVAQRLIQHIIIVKSHFKQLQTLTPIPVVRLGNDDKQFGVHREELSLSTDDAAIVEASDRKYVAYQRFLAGLYARRLGISPLTLLMDQEIMTYEGEMVLFDLNRKQDELERLAARLDEEKKAHDHPSTTSE